MRNEEGVVQPASQEANGPSPIPCAPLAAISPWPPLTVPLFLPPGTTSSRLRTSRCAPDALSGTCPGRPHGRASPPIPAPPPFPSYKTVGFLDRVQRITFCREGCLQDQSDQPAVRPRPLPPFRTTPTSKWWTTSSRTSSTPTTDRSAATCCSWLAPWLTSRHRCAPGWRACDVYLCSSHTPLFCPRHRVSLTPPSPCQRHLSKMQFGLLVQPRCQNLSRLLPSHGFKCFLHEFGELV